MHVNMDKNKVFTYLTITLTSISFYFVILNFEYVIKMWNTVIGILNPFLLGIAMAYLLWRPLKWIEKNLDKFIFRKKMGKGSIRIIGVILLYLIVLFVLMALVSFVLPQIISSLNLLYHKSPEFFKTLETSLNTLLIQNGVEGSVYQIISDFVGDLSGLIMQVTGKMIPLMVELSLKLTSGVLNTFLGVVVSIYCLVDKENFFAQIKKLMHAILPNKIIDRTSEVMNIFDDTFGRYFVGQMTDALIVGMLCFIMMSICKFEFVLLISVIVTCTNVIPYIGPFIGAVPGIFIILMTGGPVQAFWFIVMIFILQQIDGNILVPKIIGDSIGVSGFWVLFAIMVGGGLFGFIGVLLGVPTLSVVFKLLKVYAENKLRQKEKATETSAYIK
ncbi:MAG: AI-2E family transporter [Niameybacter sp.]